MRHKLSVEEKRVIRAWAAEQETVSISEISRRFRTYYRDASELLEQLYEKGIIGPPIPKGREVIKHG